MSVEINRSYLHRRTIAAIRDLSQMAGVLSDEEVTEARELLAASDEGRLVYDEEGGVYVITPRPPGPLKTVWFTFGFSHIHCFRGFRLDRDIVLEITDTDPHQTVRRLFGPTWAFSYDQPPKMEHFPRGVITLDEIIRNTDEYIVDREIIID
jgi:hypothetical protein